MEEQTPLRTTKKALKAKNRTLSIFVAFLAIALIAAIAVCIYAICTINSMRKESDAMSTKISQINDEMSALRSESVVLQGKFDEKSSDYESLKALYDELVKKNEELNNELLALESAEGSVESLTIKSNNLEKQLEALKETNTSLTKQIIELQKKISELSGDSEQTAAYTDVGKFAFLTFDDGVSKHTNMILDILDEYGVKATFFPNWKGSGIEKYQRIVNSGHTLGNHTYSHNWDTLYKIYEGQTASDKADFFFADMEKLQAKIVETTGYLPTFFRFPGGSDATIRNAEDVIPAAIPQINAAGLIYCDWNVDSGDASVRTLEKDKIVKNVLNGVKKSNGELRSPAIILMHDTADKSTTVEALPEIIEGLIAKGYTILPLSSDVPVVQRRKAA